MKDFMFLFRQPSFDYSKASRDEMLALTKRWKDWAEEIKKRGKFVSDGVRLSLEGKVLRTGGVTDGPYAETKEVIGSFIVVKADSLDEATTLARGCPALDAGGTVEIRPIVG